MVPRLQVSDSRKSFAGVRAVDGVSLSVLPGEVHALLGENGAGKSTLGKLIGGVHSGDAGEIFLDGTKLEGIDETRAGQLGIAIVHQEGSLVPQLSIAENIFAGRQPTGLFGTVDRREMHRRTEQLMRDLGADLDPARAVRSLSAAQAQVVEIAKALSRDLKLLVLDEPTSALTLTETERLFVLVRRLRDAGVAIIYITHRLPEIFALCDRVTVLKDGKVTGTRTIPGTSRLLKNDLWHRNCAHILIRMFCQSTYGVIYERFGEGRRLFQQPASEDELIRLMVGRDVYFERQGAAIPGEIVLEVENVSAPPSVIDASFSVRAGEIVCLAGLVGSGRSEICETVFGVRQRTGGTIRHKCEVVDFSGPWQAIEAGIGMMPEDRKEAGLLLSRDIADNVSVTVLQQVSPRGIVSRPMADALAEDFVDRLQIATPSTRQLVGNLSGGNQQKVLLAKWLAPQPDLLIVDEPTRGVDVGARAQSYNILRDLKAKGLAIIVVSSDLPEVLTLADRVVVMAAGRSVGEIKGNDASEESILRMATEYSAPLGEAA